MKSFLIKIFLFAFLLFVSLYAICCLANGYTDAFYLRFTTSQQTSLILGTSRAAQGLQPQIINKILARNDIFNYAFTLFDSPYGPTYLKSIEKKLSPTTKNGIFILAVDPWSISSKELNPNDSTEFLENNLHLQTKFVSMKPNIPYLINNYDEPLYTLLTQSKSFSRLHSDGWLEISVDMDQEAAKKRLRSKVKDYENNYIPFYKFSLTRVQYLLKTIDLLKQHGNVYLLELPTHPLIFEMEKRMMPNFDSLINRISIEKKVPYINLTSLNDRFTYVDGNHLYKTSGLEVSKLVGEWIFKNK